MTPDEKEKQEDNPNLLAQVVNNLASQVEEDAQAQAQEEEEIEILDLDAVKRRRSRVLIEGSQHEINRQVDLEDEEITLLNNLNKQVDEAQTAGERKPLNVQLLKIMITNPPSDEVLARLSDGETRYVKNFFYRGWGRDMEDLIRTITASDL